MHDLKNVNKPLGINSFGSYNVKHYVIFDTPHTIGGYQ